MPRPPRDGARSIVRSSMAAQQTRADAEDKADALLRAHHAHPQHAPTLARRIFALLCDEARQLESSPLTATLARELVLRHGSFEHAIGSAVATKLSLPAAVRDVLIATFCTPLTLGALVADIAKAWVADPATTTLIQAIFLLKGFMALAAHRAAHALWLAGERTLALLLQSRASEAFAVDIHPAASIGDGIMLDHATGVVIGATCILGGDTYILHGVTLGATGKPTRAHKRHPTIGRGCTLGAGSTVLGDVVVGDHAVVGASAVVTRDVPTGTTVVGVNQQRGPRARL